MDTDRTMDGVVLGTIFCHTLSLHASFSRMVCPDGLSPIVGCIIGPLLPLPLPFDGSVCGRPHPCAYPLSDSPSQKEDAFSHQYEEITSCKRWGRDENKADELSRVDVDILLMVMNSASEKVITQKRGMTLSSLFPGRPSDTRLPMGYLMILHTNAIFE
jgi:hypothetical protein